MIIVCAYKPDHLNMYPQIKSHRSINLQFDYWKHQIHGPQRAERRDTDRTHMTLSSCHGCFNINPTVFHCLGGILTKRHNWKSKCHMARDTKKNRVCGIRKAWEGKWLGASIKAAGSYVSGTCTKNVMEWHLSWQCLWALLHRQQAKV